jgi:hypothetical protein
MSLSMSCSFSFFEITSPTLKTPRRIIPTSTYESRGRGGYFGKLSSTSKVTTSADCVAIIMYEFHLFGLIFVQEVVCRVVWHVAMKRYDSRHNDGFEFA